MTYVTNKLRKLLNDGKVALGVTVQLGSPENVEIAGHLGYDWVWIDAEHGTMDLNMIANLVRAARATGISSVVRVPDHTSSFITRVFDAGADGIIVPHVKSKAIAEAVVAAAKFGPDGSRGGCPSTGATGHSVFNWNEFWPAANRDTHVWGRSKIPKASRTSRKSSLCPAWTRSSLVPSTLRNRWGMAETSGAPRSWNTNAMSRKSLSSMASKSSRS